MGHHVIVSVNLFISLIRDVEIGKQGWILLSHCLGNCGFDLRVDQRLLLLLLRRLPPDDPAVEIIGDRALLDGWLGATPF